MSAGRQKHDDGGLSVARTGRREPGEPRIASRALNTGSHCLPAAVLPVPHLDCATQSLLLVWRPPSAKSPRQFDSRENVSKRLEEKASSPVDSQNSNLSCLLTTTSKRKKKKRGGSVLFVKCLAAQPLVSERMGSRQPAANLKWVSPRVFFSLFQDLSRGGWSPRLPFLAVIESWRNPHGSASAHFRPPVHKTGIREVEYLIIPFITRC